jgi:hypothetical protein
MEDAQKKLVDKIKSANNILVTVSRDPSVDQLAALIGLTLLLNKEDKHAAAVFSGSVPSTIEFLKPDETIEKNTDSLRDFIIALDKNKADKLRYKVEDNVVRIFITPYKTSITQDDFEFTQGDLNVDLIVALGVQKQDDLDEAIMAHGQILHDATIASINVTADGGLGTITWHEPAASSLSELITRLAQAMNESPFDEQIATALLTGIVAETDRFSNAKTNPQTMSASATLMSAGANQQLVASSLQDGGEIATNPVRETDPADSSPTIPPAETQPSKSNDGSLAIDHDADTTTEVQLQGNKDGTELTPLDLPQADLPKQDEPVVSEPQPVETPTADLPTFELPAPNVENLPSEAGQSMPEPAPSPLQTPMPADTPIVQPGPGQQPGSLAIPDLPVVSPLPVPAPPVSTESTSTAPPLPNDLVATGPDPTQPTDEVRTHETLKELEEAVASPHLKDDPTLGTARDEVNKALNDINAIEPPQPSQSLGAVQFGKELRPSDLPSDPGAPPPAAPASDAAQPAAPTDPNAPPPVPPPIPFQFGNPPPQQ